MHQWLFGLEISGAAARVFKRRLLAAAPH